MFSDAATEVERVFRGHLGRIRARNALQDRTEARQICLFQYFAIQMQRSFRGYYSRKYKRNHASRKAYVKTVIDKNNQVLSMMENYANEQAQVNIKHHSFHLSPVSHDVPNHIDIICQSLSFFRFIEMGFCSRHHSETQKMHRMRRRGLSRAMRRTCITWLVHRSPRGCSTHGPR